MSETLTRTATVHATFCLERVFDAEPSRVFAALSTAEGKSAWFGGEELIIEERSLDFRVGGRERLAGRWPGGAHSDFQATYHDIVENQRIVYVYDLYRDGRKLSVSLATFDLAPEGHGRTRLALTEQGAFLDGYEDAGSREHGTGILLDRLGEALARGAAITPNVCG